MLKSTKTSSKFVNDDGSNGDVWTAFKVGDGGERETAKKR
jgi:hypothetical protein